MEFTTTNKLYCCCSVCRNIKNPYQNTSVCIWVNPQKKLSCGIIYSQCNGYRSLSIEDTYKYIILGYQFDGEESRRLFKYLVDISKRLN